MSGSNPVDPPAELMSELRALVASGGSINQLDERKVRNVVDGMRDAFDMMKSIESNPYANTSLPFYATPTQYYKAKYLRDKRCLLTYLLWRQKQISDAWWTAQDNHIRPSLSTDESEYLLEYNNLMVEYMTHFAVPVDLRAFLWRPPAFTQLEVRGLIDHVFVSPITGNTISIYSGKQILLNFEDAESLIQQHVVELV